MTRNEILQSLRTPLPGHGMSLEGVLARAFFIQRTEHTETDREAAQTIVEQIAFLFAQHYRNNRAQVNARTEARINRLFGSMERKSDESPFEYARRLQRISGAFAALEDAEKEFEEE
jgi:hypothetical protein